MMGISNIKICRHGPTKIFRFNGVDYLAADKRGVSKFNGDLVINFTGVPNKPLKEFEELTSHFKISFKEELLIPWPDFGLPNVKLSMWGALHEFIKGRGWNNVCFHCEAGHGRTGTALASMMIANLGNTPEKVLDYIRKKYCEEVVETEEQCNYLELVDKVYNGREIPKESPLIPSMFFKIEAAKEKKNKNLIRMY